MKGKPEVNNVWTTAKVHALLKDFNRTGVIPDLNPFFKRDVKRRKGGLVWEYTREEILELAACQSNVLRYAKHCTVMTEKGLQKIVLRPYQVVVLKLLQINPFFLYLASRQIGKSIVIAIFIGWLTTFFPDTPCLLGSENHHKAKDLKKKLDVMIFSMPLYMQNGVEYHSTMRTIWDNGSSVVSEATTENFGVSGSYKVVYADEFALLEAYLQDAIITHLTPTMDTFGDDARFIISTTPRGKKNKFASMWFDSLEGLNKFGNFTTKWFEIDGRGANWRKDKVSLMGEDGFSQEYDLNFDVDSTLLLLPEIQKDITDKIESYTYYKKISIEILKNYILPDRENNVSNINKNELDEEAFYEKIKQDKFENIFCVKDGYSIDNLADPSRQFVISTDLAEGVGKDFNEANIFEIVLLNLSKASHGSYTVTDETSLFGLKQVAYIRTNLLEVEDFAKFCYYIIAATQNPDNYRMALEVNFEGNMFIKTLFEVNGENNVLDPSTMMVEFPWNMEFDDALTFKMGIKQTNKTKVRGSKKSKKFIGNGRIEINDDKTVREACGFGKDKKGNYNGTTRNDDSFMTVVNVSHYFESEYFVDQVEELIEGLDDETKIFIDELVQGEDELLTNFGGNA